MFLLSGLFVWSSLAGREAAHSCKTAHSGLGLPFVVAAGLIAPIAYYPSYLQTGASGLRGFWQQWYSLANWPAGPAWFVWVLLAFDCVAAGLFFLAPKFGEKVSNLLSSISRRPFVFFLIASSNFSRGLSSHGTQVQRVLLEFIRPVLCADQPAAPLLRLFRSRDRHRSLRHQSKLAGGGWKVGPWLVAMDDCRNHCLHGEHGNRSDGYEVSKFAPGMGSRRSFYVYACMCCIGGVLSRPLHQADATPRRYLGQPQLERLRHVSHSLSIRNLGAVCATKNASASHCKRITGFSGNTGSELVCNCCFAADSSN